MLFRTWCKKGLKHVSSGVTLREAHLSSSPLFVPGLISTWHVAFGVPSLLALGVSSAPVILSASTLGVLSQASDDWRAVDRSGFLGASVFSRFEGLVSIERDDDLPSPVEKMERDIDGARNRVGFGGKDHCRGLFPKVGVLGMEGKIFDFAALFCEDFAQVIVVNCPQTNEQETQPLGAGFPKAGEHTLHKALNLLIDILRFAEDSDM